MKMNKTKIVLDKGEDIIILWVTIFMNNGSGGSMAKYRKKPVVIEVKHPPTTATIKYTDENGNVVRIEELISRKCEYCGCPEGIHESNCLFIIRYCSGHK